MNFYRFILFNTLISIASIAVAQSSCAIRFTGTVLTTAGEPLPGATILVTQTAEGKVTDVDGKFIFTGLCKGQYEVVVQFLGYKDHTIVLTLDKDSNREIRLEADIQSLDEVVIAGKHENTEHAQNLAVLNERQLSEAAGKSLGETLKAIPGVATIQTGPGIFKPVIHGLHSQRVLILNHGIRQEGQQWGAEHAPEIDPFIASELVVIKDASAI